MIEIEEIDGGLRVVDAAKNEMEIEIEGWEPGGEELEIDRNVDAQMVGDAQKFSIPGIAATIESASRDHWREGPKEEELRVSADEHLIQVEGVINMFVQFSSEFKIRSDFKSDTVTVTLPEKTGVTLGFRSYNPGPTDRIRIPPTPEGLAKAISIAGTYHRTSSPDRSYYSMREHPPLIEVDGNSAMYTSDVDFDAHVKFRLPPDLSVLFTAAPLVYYLGGLIELDRRDAPAIVTRKRKYSFPNTSTFSDDVANLISRVFYLDCLVRNVGKYSFELEELHLLEEIPLDEERVYSMTIDERLDEYLSVPFELISNKLPEWPLAVSMEPTMDNSRALPHLLDRLSLIFPPEANELDNRTIMSRSLGDFYRSSSSGGISFTTQSDSLVEPLSTQGKVKGWIAGGTAVDAFNCPPEAFINRQKYRNSDYRRSISVILNDEIMEEEFVEVVDEYEARSDFLSMNVGVKRDLSTKELAQEIQEGDDILHYIGHCDADGLRCTDGHLSVSRIPESNAQTFFLNACGSYSEGLALIRRGSVAGAVTIGDVLDKQAKRVGATFARLVTRGFNIYHALRISRSKAIMNRKYTVVGDGTSIPIQTSDTFPSVLVVSKADDGSYRIEWDCQTENYHGGVYHPMQYPYPILAGNRCIYSISREELKKLLADIQSPIIYEDSFYWPDELLEELT